MDYIKLCENLINHFRPNIKADGKSDFVLKKNELKELAEKNPELGSMLEEVAGNLERTILEITSKAVSNYEIARFKIKKQSTTIMHGGYSKTDDTLKYHITRGRILDTGYKDGKNISSHTGMITPDSRFISKEELEGIANNSKMKRAEKLAYLGGITADILERTMKALGLSFSRTQKIDILKNIDLEKFDEMVISGAPVSKIKEFFGLTKDQYLQLRKARNVDSAFVTGLKKVGAIKKEDILALKTAGKNRKEICKELGISNGALSRLERDFGIETKFKQNKIRIKEITKEKIQELDKAGYSAGEKEEILGVSHSTLQKLRHRLGATSKFQETLKNAGEVTGEDIQRCIDAGMKVKDICTKLGISKTTYKTIVSKEHLKTKRTKSLEIISQITREILDETLKKCGTMIGTGRILGVSGDTVARLADKFKIQIPGRNICGTELKEKIISRLEKGIQRKEICEELGLSFRRYGDLINRHDIMTAQKIATQRIKQIKKADLEAKLNSGLSIEEIAKSYKIGKTALHKTINRFGIKTKLRQSKEIIKNITREQFENAIKNNNNVAETCKELGISEGAYINLLIKFKVQTDFALKRKHVESITAEQIKNLIQKFDTTKEICQELSIRLQTYRTILHKFNLLTEKGIGKLRETSIKRYETYSIAELKDRLYEQFIDNEKLAKNPHVENFVEYIFNNNEYLINNTEDFIKVIRTFDLLEKKIITPEKALSNKTVKKFLFETRELARNALKKEFEFKTLVTEYKDMTDIILPSKNKEKLAALCRKHLPKDINDKNNPLIETILQTLKKTDFNSPDSVCRCENIISRLDAYLSQPEGDLLNRANAFSIETFGEILPERVGQYIINYKIMNNESPIIGGYNKEFADIVLELKRPEKLTMNYLLKIDEFFSEKIPEHKYIDDLLNKFDDKDFIDAKIIKKFVNSIYKETNTRQIATRPNGAKENVKFCAKAKQEIIAYYGYPNCLQYLQQFENALKYFAPKDNKAGIKLLTGHAKYSTEVKINDKPQRLVSSNDTYDYDTFLPTGIHNKKEKSKK